VGFLRLLIFLYTDSLPDGSDGALLEDLMSAERYHLDDMKLLCESMLVPSKQNWLDLLRASDLLGTHRLHTLTVGFLRDNSDVLLDVVDEEDGNDNASTNTQTTLSQSLASASAGSKKQARTGVAVIEDEFPGLFEKILALHSEVHPPPPSKLLTHRLHKHSAEAVAAVKHVPFPYLAVVLCVLALSVYYYTQNILFFGPYVPYFNAMCVAACLIYLVYFHKS
jgi:hypothetical protein